MNENWATIDLMLGTWPEIGLKTHFFAADLAQAARLVGSNVWLSSQLNPRSLVNFYGAKFHFWCGLTELKFAGTRCLEAGLSHQGFLQKHLLKDLPKPESHLLHSDCRYRVAHNSFVVEQLEASAGTSWTCAFFRLLSVELALLEPSRLIQVANSPPQ